MPSESPPANEPTQRAEDQTFLLLTARKAAAMCNVSLRTWRAWDVAGKIPRAIRIGRSTFWRPDDLRAWVAAGCPGRETWQPNQ